MASPAITLMKKQVRNIEFPVLNSEAQVLTGQNPQTLLLMMLLIDG